VSTHVVLDLLRIHTPCPVGILPYSWISHDTKREVLPDYLIRASSAPARLAAPYFIYQTLLKFSSNPVWLATPQMPRLLQIVKDVKALVQQAETSRTSGAVDQRIYYHVGASYLTNGQRKVMEGSMPLGIIGSFLYHLHTAHTLTRSPLITGNQPGKLKYVNQEGYDEAYDSLCLGMRMEEARGMDVGALSFLRQGSTITTTEADYVALIRETAGPGAAEAAATRHQDAVKAASKVLSKVTPVVHGEEEAEDESDVESVAAEAPGPSSGKGRGTKRTVSTRSAAKDADASKRRKEK
jgi:hypothetical protein